MNNSYQIAAYYGLSSADVIKSPKSLFDLVQHYALFGGYDANGDAWLVENVVGQGVVYTRMDQYLARVGKMTEIIPFRGNEWARQAVIDRANSRIGGKYDAFSYNCEHFVNDALYGKRKSPQVDSAMKALSGALTFMLVATVIRNL